MCSARAGILGLQRAVGNAGVTSMLEEERSPVHDVVNSGGAPAGARRPGGDAGRGSVTTSATSGCTTTRRGRRVGRSAVNAHAYTVGSNVVFQRDKYDPASAEGKTMLAHELTHVVQQRSGPVDGSSTPAAASRSATRPTASSGRRPPTPTG